MVSTLSRYVSVVALFAALCGAPSGLSGQPAAEPLEVIRASNTRIAQLMRPGHRLTPAEEGEILQIVERTSHFPTIAREVIGRRWESVPEPQREAFIAAFSRLIGLTSIEKMGRYRADRFEYAGQQVDGDRGAVRTVAFYQGKRVSLDYVMARIDGAWRIIDYSMNGVPSSRNYQKQFARILEKQDFAGLLARLDRRLASMKKPAGR
ncbi:MAG: ABC transporter substrate-binding protein [Acidobacteria bacterium]|nr:ABC transporter substrate-binding protein [Acidobacteriota bacterium]